MDDRMPRVSVITPTYKRETKYLLRAIESIKEGSYENVEIVVVDDNPPDSKYRKDVVEFMKRYESDNNVIYFMNPKNVGGSLARNNGISVASGEYITFLDDDDRYLPRKIEKQINFMLDKGCDMSFSNLKIVNEDDVLIDFREHTSVKSFEKEDLLKHHIMKHLTGTPTFMYKALKLREIGGFEDAKIGQEFYLMLKSIENDLDICYLNDCDVVAYVHSGERISQGKNKIVGENELYNFKRKYFDLFSLREKMYIRFRHYAVMAVSYKRDKEYIKALKSTLIMFISSPIDFVNEGFKFVFSKFNKNRLKTKESNS